VKPLIKAGQTNEAVMPLESEIGQHQKLLGSRAYPKSMVT